MKRVVWIIVILALILIIFILSIIILQKNIQPNPAEINTTQAFNITNISLNIISIEWSNNSFSIFPSFFPNLNLPNLTNWNSLCKHATNLSDPNISIYRLGTLNITYYLNYTDPSEYHTCLLNDSEDNFESTSGFSAGNLNYLIPITNIFNIGMSVNVLSNHTITLCCTVNKTTACAPTLGTISPACDQNGNSFI